MNRVVIASAAAALIAAAGAGLVAATEPGRAPIYYQDPDGKPFYSLTPKKTSGGRDFRAIPAGADVSFDEPTQDATPSSSTTERKIKYYRNPMGLPDTSPVPKKDSMGMAYIAVYEGDDFDDGSVKLSPGKIQRTGAKSEPAAN